MCQKVTVWFGSAQHRSSIWSFNNADGAWGALSERDREEMKQAVCRDRGTGQMNAECKGCFLNENKRGKETGNEWGKYWWASVCARSLCNTLVTVVMSFPFSFPASNQKWWEENIDFEREKLQIVENREMCVSVCVFVMEKEGIDKDKERQPGNCYWIQL